MKLEKYKDKSEYVAKKVNSRANVCIGNSDIYGYKLGPIIRSNRFNDKVYLNVDCDSVLPDVFNETLNNGIIQNQMVRSGRKGELHRFYLDDNDNLEYEIEWDSISEIPDDYKITLTLDFPQGLSFYKQLALTPQEIDEGSTRPDNIVNSYAVYWNKSGRYKGIGYDINYETGKYCHIDAPRLIDNNGQICWCDQIISGNKLYIYLPPKWMQEAAYPVILDPTFGYTSIGASSTTISAYAVCLVGTLTTYTASTNDALTGFFVYGSNSSSNPTTMSAYTINTTPVPVNRLSDPASVALTNTPGWRSVVGLLQNLSNGVKYGPAIQASSVNIRYDTTTGNNRSLNSSASLTTTWSSTGLSATNYSIYATYENIAPVSPRGKRKIIIT